MGDRGLSLTRSSPRESPTLHTRLMIQASACKLTLSATGTSRSPRQLNIMEKFLRERLQVEDIAEIIMDMSEALHNIWQDTDNERHLLVANRLEELMDELD